MWFFANRPEICGEVDGFLCESLGIFRANAKISRFLSEVEGDSVAVGRAYAGFQMNLGKLGEKGLFFFFFFFYNACHRVPLEASASLTVWRSREVSNEFVPSFNYRVVRDSNDFDRVLGINGSPAFPSPVHSDGESHVKFARKRFPVGR